MKTKAIAWLFFFVVLTGTVWAGEKMESCEVTMGIRLASPECVEGEPVLFFLDFENRSDHSARIVLGERGVENLRIVLECDGSIRALPVPEGFGGMNAWVQLFLIAGERKSWAVFLDEFSGPLPPGKYRMHVSVGDGVAAHFLENCMYPEATGEFQVLSQDMDSCDMREARFKTWMKEAQTGEDEQRQNTARKAVLLARHPVAVQAQMTLVRNKEWRNLDEAGKLAEALLDAETEEALQTLVDAMLLDNSALSPERQIVLHALRKRDAGNWQVSKRRIIEPFLEEIEKATPFHFSD
jgi:hypothetical protein